MLIQLLVRSTPDRAPAISDTPACRPTRQAISSRLGSSLRPPTSHLFNEHHASCRSAGMGARARKCTPCVVLATREVVWLTWQGGGVESGGDRNFGTVPRGPDLQFGRLQRAHESKLCFSCDVALPHSPSITKRRAALAS